MPFNRLPNRLNSRNNIMSISTCLTRALTKFLCLEKSSNVYENSNCFLAVNCFRHIKNKISKDDWRRRPRENPKSNNNSNHYIACISPIYLITLVYISKEHLSMVPLGITAPHLNFRKFLLQKISLGSTIKIGSTLHLTCYSPLPLPLAPRNNWSPMPFQDEAYAT